MHLHIRCGSPRSVIANVVDCDAIGSEFKLQFHNYVHLRVNTSGKGMNLLIRACHGLKCITSVLLKGLL